MVVLQVWDTVATVAIKSCRGVPIVVHHLFVLAFCGIAFKEKIMLYYAGAGCGVIEITTLPLCWVTLWRPDRCAGMIEGSKALQSLNSALRILFAVLFFAIRVAWFSLYAAPL